MGNDDRTGSAARARVRQARFPRRDHRRARTLARERHGARDRRARRFQGRGGRGRRAEGQPALQGRGAGVRRPGRRARRSRLRRRGGHGGGGGRGGRGGAPRARRVRRGGGGGAGAGGGPDVVDVFDEEEAWDVLEELPNDAAAALILLEHRWAIGLRDAVVRAGGLPIARPFIRPLDLVEVGLVSAEEAEKLAAADSRRSEERRGGKEGRSRWSP